MCQEVYHCIILHCIAVLCCVANRHCHAAVRVINCDGSASSSAVIAGLEWLAQNVQLPAVASMSLGSDSPNQALDDAVTAVIALGVTAVVAAGNYNQGGHLQSQSSRKHVVHLSRHKL